MKSEQNSPLVKLQPQSIEKPKGKVSVQTTWEYMTLLATTTTKCEKKSCNTAINHEHHV